MKKWKWDTPYRSVYAFDMTHFHRRLRVGTADIRDFLVRSVMCAGPRDIVLYDKSRPFPKGFLAYLRRIGLAAYAYIGVRAGEGSLFERLMYDEVAQAELRAIQEQDGLPLLLKPYLSTPDAWRFARHMRMRYFFGPEVKLAKKMRDKAYVRNNILESRFLRWSNKEGEKYTAPVTEGRVCVGHEAIRFTAQEYFAKRYTVVVKDNLLFGASGDGFNIFSSIDQLDAYLPMVPKAREVIVERWYQKTSSPSIIVETRQGRVRVLETTQQMVTPTGGYLGNIIPSGLSKVQEGTCKRYGKVLGEYVAGLGYEGIFGMDFIVVQGEVLIVEVNFRFTGSYFLVAAMKRLQHTAVATCTTFKDEAIDRMQFDYHDIQEAIEALDLNPGQYVIPHNVRCYPEHEGGLIILASSEKERSGLYGRILGALLAKKHGSHLPLCKEQFKARSLALMR